ncbi:fructose-bisphosphate aldolase 1, chloroplastic-like [Primulina huaijiensis]|uniref:fructose-bisphosphate aldolase 1, chloroplastic-like n=1 Tax=Primulina huaijiensis TaxID=1492673 RepID=UPI003CC74EB7
MFLGSSDSVDCMHAVSSGEAASETAWEQVATGGSDERGDASTRGADAGLVPIVEPEIQLDGDHGIERTFEVALRVWAEVFFHLAENNVLFEGILLKPSIWLLPEPKFLSGGQSEVEATLNLNAMNQGPNPWHVSFSYARALQNTCLKTWGGRPMNVKAAQDTLLVRAKANSLAQLGKYTAEGESEEARTGMFVKGYNY